MTVIDITEQNALPGTSDLEVMATVPTAKPSDRNFGNDDSRSAAAAYVLWRQRIGGDLTLPAAIPGSIKAHMREDARKGDNSSSGFIIAFLQEVQSLLATAFNDTAAVAASAVHARPVHCMADETADGNVTRKILLRSVPCDDGGGISVHAIARKN